MHPRFFFFASERAVAQTKVTLLAISQNVLVTTLTDEGFLDNVIENFQNMLNQEERRKLARRRFMGAIQKVINATGWVGANFSGFVFPSLGRRFTSHLPPFLFPVKNLWLYHDASRAQPAPPQRPQH